MEQKLIIRGKILLNRSCPCLLMRVCGNSLLSENLQCFNHELFQVDEDYISADDVTSSLLAVLKGDLSPADKLLNAIHRTNWSSV